MILILNNSKIKRFIYKLILNILMESTDIEKELTYMEVEFLRRISMFINNHQDLMIKEIAKKISTNISNPKFYKILNILFKNNILEITKIYGKTKLLYLNEKKLVKFINAQQIAKNWSNYYYKHGILLS